MSEWYYAKDGKQNGPVSREHLGGLLKNGTLNPAKDLVWTETMKNWIPAAQVPELSVSASNPADPSNPYAAPESSWAEAVPITQREALEEISPGSEPISVSACVMRGFHLTVRHFGMILLVGLVYIGITIAGEVAAGMMDAVFWPAKVSEPIFITPSNPQEEQLNQVMANFEQNSSPLNMLLTQLLSVFLSIGLTRIGLNLTSGKEFTIGMLFGGGGKLLPAFGATILYGLMVAVGLLLLIVPGIYLAIRYGQYLTAMVDRDLGVMESFRYSSSLTTGNRMNLFLLLLMSIAIVTAGFVALCVGMVFAIPVAYLSWIAAYRWMQYGPRAVMDHPGTQTPMVVGIR